MHARFGQGDGLALRATYTGTANSTAFGADDPNDTQFTVAQAWYQLEVLSPSATCCARRPSPSARSTRSYSLTRTPSPTTKRAVLPTMYLCTTPLLDSGGDVGADRFGFAPGAIAAYEDTSDKAMPWGVSLGAFGRAVAHRSAGANGAFAGHRAGLYRAHQRLAGHLSGTPGAMHAPPILTTAKRAQRFRPPSTSARRTP